MQKDPLQVAGTWSWLSGGGGGRRVSELEEGFELGQELGDQDEAEADERGLVPDAERRSDDWGHYPLVVVYDCCMDYDLPHLPRPKPLVIGAIKHWRASTTDAWTMGATLPNQNRWFGPV